MRVGGLEEIGKRKEERKRENLSPLKNLDSLSF